MRWFVWAILAVLSARSGLSGAPLVEAHLDPPGPPAFLETINALAAVVLDDTDPTGPGEISLTWDINPPAPHIPETGGIRVPAVGTLAIPAPPALNLLPRGAGLWSMQNCTPLERQVMQTVVLRDDDAPFGFEDLINVTAAVPAGVSPVATPFGFVVLSFSWAMMPQLDAACKPPEAEGQAHSLAAATRWPEAISGPPPTLPATSFSPAQPGPYAFLQPTEAVTFTFRFTNTTFLADNFVFDVDVPVLGVPGPSEVDPLRQMGTIVSGTASWGSVTTPGASTGIALNPGEAVDLELLVAVPGGTPFGYYQLGIGGTSQIGFILVPEYVILEVRDKPLGPRRLTYLPLVSQTGQPPP
jgi:hypothetical protein